MKSERAHFFALVAAALLLAAPWFATREFYTRGEAREALVAQAMIRSGNWILPRTYDGAVPSKPPFTHWLSALTAECTGVLNQFSSRFPAAAAFVAITAAWYCFLRPRVGAAQAFSSTLLLLLSFEWMRSAVSCRVDTVLAALMLGSSLFLLRWFERGFAGLPIGAAACLAGAALTKGPVGVMLPLAVLAVFQCIRGSGFGAAIRVTVLPALPAAAIAAVWYFAAYRTGGDQFADKVWYENVLRFLSEQEDEPHRHSILYLYLTFSLGLLPALLGVFPLLRSVRRPRFGALLESFKRSTALTQYAIISVAVFLLFFSLPSGKRSVYLLPVVPFAAYLIGIAMSAEEWRILRRFGAWGTLAALLAAPAAIVLVFGMGAPPEFGATIARLLNPGSFTGAAFAALYLTAGCALLSYIIQHRRGHAMKARCSLLAAVFSIAVAVQGPILNAFGGAVGERRFVELVRPFLGLADDFYSYDFAFYGTSFYLNRPMWRFKQLPDHETLIAIRVEDIPELRTLVEREGRAMHILAQTTLSVVRMGKPAAFVFVSRRLKDAAGRLPGTS